MQGDREGTKVILSFNTRADWFSADGRQFFNIVWDAVFVLNVLCVHNAAGITSGKCNLGQLSSILWINVKRVRLRHCAYGERH